MVESSIKFDICRLTVPGGIAFRSPLASASLLPGQNPSSKAAQPNMSSQLIFKRFTQASRGGGRKWFSENAPKDYISLHFKDYYEVFKYWRMGKSRGADIIFIVGINDKRIEKETRMHVKEYVRRAPDLYPKDLKQLYDYYQNRPKDHDPMKLTAYGGYMITKKGIQIQMPEDIDEPDFLVSHDDIQTNILPEWKNILKTIEEYEYQTNRMRKFWTAL